MNSLSWVLYFADVATNMQPVFVIAAFIAFGFMIIGIIAGRFVIWDYEGRSEIVSNSKAQIRKIGNVFSILLPIFIIIAVLIPSKQTFYMIAASQIGEQVLVSDEMKEIYSEVRKTVLNELRSYNEKSNSRQ